jgi:4-amino-4-deoxy-L-arabinose transferase-like glycosyltransferase
VSAENSAQRGVLRSRLAASSVVPGTATVELAVLACILVAGGVLFHRGLSVPPSFDESVYLAQGDALLHGQHLGAQIFAAQPPGWYWLIAAAGKIGGLSIDTGRLAVMAVALLGVAGVYFVARLVAGSVAGLAAAAVLVVSPPYPTFAAQVSADLPGCVLAVLSLACVLAAMQQRPRLFAPLAGVLFACAELVKLDAFIVVLPVLAYLAVRRLRPSVVAIALAAAAATVAIAAAALGGDLSGVWHGAISYHVAARSAAGRYENVHALRSFFDLRQPLTWMTVAALVATIWLRPRARFWPFWAAAVVGALFLLWQRPLHDNHLVVLAVLLAVPIGATFAAVGARLPLPALVVVAVLLLGGYVQETRRLDRNAAPIPAGLTSAAAQVDAHSTPQQLIVSDEPLVPFLAHRRIPGSVIDTAVLRFDAGYLSNQEVLRAIDDDHVPVVVAGRAFLQRPALLAAIAARFPARAVYDGVRVYTRAVG